MFVSYRKIPRRKLPTGDLKTKHVRKYKYLGNGLTHDSICETGIRRFTGIANDAFQILYTELRSRNVSFETKSNDAQLLFNISHPFIARNAGQFAHGR